jgi:hypothetical protein
MRRALSLRPCTAGLPKGVQACPETNWSGKGELRSQHCFLARQSWTSSISSLPKMAHFYSTQQKGRNPSRRRASATPPFGVIRAAGERNQSADQSSYVGRDRSFKPGHFHAETAPQNHLHRFDLAIELIGRLPNVFSRSRCSQLPQ